MASKMKIFVLLLVAATLLGGCSLRTLDELYCPPKRSEDYDNLQSLIDEAMEDLTYSAPISGQNPQAVQNADLDGDGVDEFLLFAKDDSENPLKILIFCQVASGYVLMDTIEGYGFAFDFVTYAQMDDREGVEIIVGRRVSDELARSVSVYRFTSGFSHKLLSTGYAQLAVSDLNEDGLTELLLFNAGASESNNGMAMLYTFTNGELQRRDMATMSKPISSLHQVEAGLLEDGTPAVFVTSAEEENSLIVDVFAVVQDVLVNLSQGIQIPSVRNYLVYPTDIDGDGVVELAQPVEMEPVRADAPAEYLLEWNSLDISGTRKVKAYTYHDFADGWYLFLDQLWAGQMRAERTEDDCACYLPDKATGKLQRVMTVYAFTGSDRENQAAQKGRLTLYKGDSIIYAADLEETAALYGITEEYLLANFRPIRMEWNTEESGGQL